MKIQNRPLLLATAILLSGCHLGQTQIDPVYTSTAKMSGDNVVPINVSCGYLNEPCVSVTICNPTTGQCQVVNNILLDTGSYGLRVFSSQVQSLGLTPVTSGGKMIAECQNYLDNSADWGPLAMAVVQLGNEKTQQPIPIQLIDANFPSSQTTAGAGAQSAGCENPDDTPANAGYNGILGVGPHIADCGPTCVTWPGNSSGGYFACDSNGNCSGTTVLQGAPGLNLPVFQVSNPVAYLAQDNNGIAVILPDISSAGVAGATGYMILGIGTNSNNTSTTATVIPTDQFGDFSTTFDGKTYTRSFADTGSNALFFPKGNTGLVSTSSGFYNTPQNLQAFTAQISDGANDHAVDFNVLSANIAFSGISPNMAFNDVAAEFSGGFDWGLPFFFGRTVFVGISGTSSNLGAGPYLAF